MFFGFDSFLFLGVSVGYELYRFVDVCCVFGDLCSDGRGFA